MSAQTVTPSPAEPSEAEWQLSNLAHSRCEGLAITLQMALEQLHRVLGKAELEDLSEQQIDRVSKRLKEVFTALIGSGVGAKAECAEIALRMEPHGVAFANLLAELADAAWLSEDGDCS